MTGILKRMQGTPLPRWAYVAARIGSTLMIVGAITALTLILGGDRVRGDAPRADAPGLIVTLVLGTAAFTTLGIGMTRFIPNAETAPVIINLVVLPLTFISNIWFPADNMPSALNTIAKIFPIRALADGLQYAFDPRTTGAGLNGHDVRTLAVWAVIGVMLMLRFLRQPAGRGGVTEPAQPPPSLRDRYRGRTPLGGCGSRLAGLHRDPADQRDHAAIRPGRPRR